ncbi:MAG: hypothetical protein ACXAD7_19815, partial [Candidatus Kariarchaeaceae archaeon]
SITSLHLIIDLIINDLMSGMSNFVQILTLVTTFFLMILGYFISAENESFIDHNFRLIEERNRLQNEIKQLERLLPICSHCHQIRDENDNWDPIEKYVAQLPDIKLTHSVCDDCYQEHYSDIM